MPFELQQYPQMYTRVLVHDDPGAGGAYHKYKIIHPHNDFDILTDIAFQKGAIKDAGVNGCMNEDLLRIVLHRLQCFQEGEFKCRENALAVTKIEEALHWLQQRTTDRERRGVEGTMVK